jgi:hypothetical protein
LNRALKNLTTKRDANLKLVIDCESEVLKILKETSEKLIEKQLAGVLKTRHSDTNI